MSADEQLDLIGSKPAKPKRVTLVTPFGDAWTRHTGGVPPWGKLRKAVKTIRDQSGHDTEEILSRFQVYLARTPPERCSPIRFMQTYGAWTPERQRVADVDKRLDAEQARRVRAIEPRECVDPVAIGRLVADLERRGKEVPGWIRKAADK
jgi:hypothetical protein